ncbi:MAG: iron-containing alcohol dehydrogenase [Clostridiales bacterium]|nr:iron-containing alcohol dehydrogenase [Clostridiales bacterium]
MNVFSKAYCRIFQGVFKLALPLLPYKDPQIKRSISDIPSVLADKKLSHPLIVTDASLFGCGAVQPLISALETSGVAYSIYKDVVANPTTENVAAALEIYKTEGCDCLIAFGGGSPMDTAKAVGARVARPKKSLGKMRGILKVRKKIPYLVAVPTTCGTGSETTLASVIVDAETRDKYAINDFPLIPKVAVLDPSVLKGLPDRLVAYTGLDALTHAVEAFIGRSTTKSTRADALAAMKLVFENLTAAVGGDMEARAQMLDAAHLAGRAFSKSYVGYVHALAHALGGKYNVPHGFANAVLLPVVLEAYGKKINKKLSKAAKYCGLVDKDADKAIAAKAFLVRLEELETELGIPAGFDCIKREDIAELSAHAAKEANPLYPVPVLWDKKKLSAVYEKVMLTEAEADNTASTEADGEKEEN